MSCVATVVTKVTDRDKLSYWLRGRRYHSHPPRIAAQTWLLVELLLQQQWSPVTNRCTLKFEAAADREPRMDLSLPLCRQTASGPLLPSFAQSKEAAQTLWCARAPSLRFLTASASMSGPRSSRTRLCLGEWEADTIIGARHKGLRTDIRSNAYPRCPTPSGRAAVSTSIPRA